MWETNYGSLGGQLSRWSFKRAICKYALVLQICAQGLQRIYKPLNPEEIELSWQIWDSMFHW